LLAELGERDILAFGVDEGAADLALPVIEVRHYDVVADRRDATRQVVELLAHAPDIHVENDGGKWAVLFRVGDERLHASVGGRDLREAFFHGGLPPKKTRSTAGNRRTTPACPNAAIAATE